MSMPSSKAGFSGSFAGRSHPNVTTPSQSVVFKSTVISPRSVGTSKRICDNGPSPATFCAATAKALSLPCSKSLIA